MDKVKQVVDKIVHPKDHSSTTSTTHTTGDPTHTGNHTATHSGTNTGITGNHTATHAGTNTGVTGTSGGVGPHSSSLLNKADPTVDSDFDGSRNLGAAKHGPGAVHNNQPTTGTGLTGSNHSSGLTGAAVTGTHGSAPTGPHSSNLANKLDPRVSDGSSNTGLTGNNHGTTGSSGLTGGYGATGSTNAGPHNSNILNTADPRVDSDRDGSRNMGASQYGPGGVHNQHSTTSSGLTGNTHSSGLTGNNHSSGLTGNNHSSGLTGNNHSSGLTGNNHGNGLTGNNHGTHGHVTGALTGGPAPTTAGPHKSDMMNKIDPRVDSDRDGSKTIGQAPAPQY